jgi:Domain of unknown function (DUF1707)
MPPRNGRTIERVSDYQPSDIRVSDSEREDALGKLGEHMSEGRLDIDEFGERSAKVTSAKTRGELLDIFGDLPEPRPAFGRPAPPPAPVPVPGMSFGQRAVPVLVGVVAAIMLLGMTMASRFPFILLLPFVIFALSGARWRRQDQRWRDAQRHRHHRHEWRDGFH